MRSKNNPELMDAVIEALKRSDKPITAVQLSHRIPQYPIAALRSALGYLSLNNTVNSIKVSGGPNVFEITRQVANNRQYEWRDYVPPVPTVIPVRERGRLAPDVSDGLIVSMVSRVADTRRMDQ